MKVLSVENKDFKSGLYRLDDDVNAPFGSARSMRNAVITDRGGIANRPGTEILGTYESGNGPILGLYNFKKSLNLEEFPIRAYNISSTETVLDYYHSTQGWQRLKGGFTASKRFGFTTSLVNVENEDFVYFSNRHEPYQRWQGSVTELNGALAGGETEVVVASVLKSDQLENRTATSSSTTTLGVSSSIWVTDQWKGFYVHILAGGEEGQIREISANTTSQVTFSALSSDPGSVEFEIKQAAFPSSGTIIYNGTNLAYTAIDKSTAFTVASAHSASDGTPVTIVPEEFPGAPRGNRLENLLTRVFVGNIRSARSRDSSDNLQGSTSAGSVFVSNIQDPSDFTFQATRVAGEGDILSTPYGGGQINDIKAQEDVAYIYKDRYIEAVAYSQDSNDIAVREPLKTGAGSVGRVIKGRDDHYFVNADKELTSLGRVVSKDIKPQTENLGHIIKLDLEKGVYDEFTGIESADKIYMAYKKSSDSDQNDRILVFNKVEEAFEGSWVLSANDFIHYKGGLYYGSSVDSNVWEMLKDENVDKQANDTDLPLTTSWQSNFFNVLPRRAEFQSIMSLGVTGFIRANTFITFELFKDFFTSPSLRFEFGGTEEQFLKGDNIANFLGGSPLGVNAIGSFSEPNQDGRRRFYFQVYFPFIHAQELSVAVSTEGKYQDFEINSIAYGLLESPSTQHGRVKTI